MKLSAASCLTCRMIRRFLLSLLFGAVLAWQVTGTLPFDAGNENVMPGLMLVVVLFSGISIFIRMREMRSRFRRNH